MHMRVLLSRYRSYTTCPRCNGGRFQPEALNYKIVAAVSDRRKQGTAVSQPPQGALASGSVELPARRESAPPCLTLPEIQALSISTARDLLTTIDIGANDSTAQMLRDEICARLSYLCEVGVGYLTLDR